MAGDTIQQVFCRACETNKACSDFYVYKRGGHLSPYCKSCAVKGKKCPPEQRLMYRFWAKVQKTEGCWLWLGVPDGGGYGAIKINRKSVGAHQYAYDTFKGPRNGLHVLHECDNKLCVNPDHLFLGTNADNVRDKVQKGRQPRGEANPLVKLTEAQVREARRLSAEGWTTCKIGDHFGVHNSTISNILVGITWRHVS